MVSNGISRALRGIVISPSFSPGPGIKKNDNSSQEPLPKLVTPSFSQDELPLVKSLFSPAQSQISPSAKEIGHTASRDSHQIAASSQSSEFPDPNVDAARANLPIENQGKDTLSVSAADKDLILNLRVIGAISDLFLVAEGKEGMVLIDQHAAHERVLFEKVLTEMKKKDGIKQGLLIPVTIDFSNADTKILQGNLTHMVNLGFEIDHFGGNTFIVNAVPAHFPQENLTGMLLDMLDELRDSPFASKRVDEAKIAKIACKAAVKARDHLKESEISKLLAELAAAELPYTCPHGRPTMISISIKELEKRFGRRQ